MQSQREAEPVEHPHPCQGCLKIEKAESREDRHFLNIIDVQILCQTLYMLFHMIPTLVRSVVVSHSQRKETDREDKPLSEARVCAFSTAQCTSGRYVCNQNTIEESKAGLRVKKEVVIAFLRSSSCSLPNKEKD